MQSFIFGGDTGETAKSIARKRRIAQQLMAANSRAPRDVGEGLTAIGRALQARVLGNRADEAEEKGRAEWDEAFGSRFGQMDTEAGTQPAYNMSHIVDALNHDFAPDSFKSIAPLLAQQLKPAGPRSGVLGQYDEAVKQGFDGTLLDYQTRLANARRSVNNVSVNTGPTGIDYGDPPKDMAWKRTPDQKIALDERGAPIPVPLQNTQAMRDVQAAKEERMGAYDKASDTIAVIDSIMNDDQLPLATGWGSFVPIDLPGINARVRSKIEQIEGAAFLQAFESLKGGGQITEVEGRKATQAVARLKTAQKYEDFKEALGELRAIAVRAQQRAQQAGVAEVGDAPEGVEPDVWQQMTPEQRALWQN